MQDQKQHVFNISNALCTIVSVISDALSLLNFSNILEIILPNIAAIKHIPVFLLQ